VDISNEFNFLTEETVRLSEGLSDREFEREFLLSSLGEREGHALIDQLQSQERTFPQAPGLVYHLIKSGTTFSVRGVACDCIDDIANDLYSGEKHILRALRIEEKDLDEELLFFETEDQDQAEIIADAIFNKRFPLEEDILCNISDPGFSWWYARTSDGFRVNFKSHKLTDSGERIKLGPIGDVVVAAIRINRLKDHFKFHMPISEIIINEKQFVLKSSDATHPILKELMEIFELGIISDDSALLCELDKTLKLYLKEIAATRRFWLQIEQHLAKNPCILN
jgi:hypothetical protein